MLDIQQVIILFGNFAMFCHVEFKIWNFAMAKITKKNDTGVTNCKRLFLHLFPDLRTSTE